jgi:hypothetical protein
MLHMANAALCSEIDTTQINKLWAERTVLEY